MKGKSNFLAILLAVRDANVIVLLYGLQIKFDSAIGDSTHNSVSTGCEQNNRLDDAQRDKAFGMVH